MERWPGGYRPDVKLSTRSDSHGEAFYQKRAPSKGMPDWVETVTITFPSGRTADEVCATELATIAWMANLGTLRYHPWPVTRADTEKVDQLRIDLDPQPGTDSPMPHAPRTSCVRCWRTLILWASPRPAGAAGFTCSCRLSLRTASSKPGMR